MLKISVLSVQEVAQRWALGKVIQLARARAIRSLGVAAVAAIATSCASVSNEPLVPLSDHFAIKRISGGSNFLGLDYRWEGQEIYLRRTGKPPLLLGTVSGGPPTGLGPFAEAAKDLRQITLAVSVDGRSLVFNGEVRSPNRQQEAGIYQYSLDAGLQLVHPREDVLEPSHARWSLPADVLPFSYSWKYQDKFNDKFGDNPRATTDQGFWEPYLKWVIRATGEEFPLALLEATPLHWAAFEGRTDDCSELIERGADIDAVTYLNFSALDLSIIFAHQETALRLLTLGANPDVGVYPAFHRAVALGRTDVARELLSRRLDVNESDGAGDTPLHHAARGRGGNTSVLQLWRIVSGTVHFYQKPQEQLVLVRMLLDYGADPDRQNRSGKTPLDLAYETESVEAARLLEAHVVHH